LIDALIMTAKLKVMVDCITDSSVMSPLDEEERLPIEHHDNCHVDLFFRLPSTSVHLSTDIPTRHFVFCCGEDYLWFPQDINTDAVKASKSASLFAPGL
jgi:hypothetical protein